MPRAAHAGRWSGGYVFVNGGPLLVLKTGEIAPALGFEIAALPRDTPLGFELHTQYDFATGDNADLEVTVNLSWRFRPTPALALYPLLGFGVAYTWFADGTNDSLPILRYGGGAEWWLGDLFLGVEVAAIGRLPSLTGHVGWRF